jgi:hypothetical protein
MIVWTGLDGLDKSAIVLKDRWQKQKRNEILAGAQTGARLTIGEGCEPSAGVAGIFGWSVRYTYLSALSARQQAK